MGYPRNATPLDCGGKTKQCCKCGAVLRHERASQSCHCAIHSHSVDSWICRGCNRWEAEEDRRAYETASKRDKMVAYVGNSGSRPEIQVKCLCDRLHDPVACSEIFALCTCYGGKT